MAIIPIAKPIRKRTKPVIKKAKVKKPKTKSLSWYKREADRVFSLFIRARDKNTCICCGSTVSPQNGHYVQRDILPLRYHEKNCHCQCRGCNVFKKGNYPIYTVRMLDKYGPDWLYELDEVTKKYRADRIKGLTGSIFTKEWYQGIINMYK